LIRVLFIITIFLLSLQAKSEIKGYYAKNKDVKRFINFMIRKHNFKRSYLIEVFSKASKPRRFKTKRVKRKVVHG
jgi:hypothetical protein